MENIKRAFKQKLSTNTLLGILFILMMGDYFISYFGIHHLDIIEEANPIMVNFLKLPLWEGTIIKIFYSLFLILLFKIVEKYKNPIVFRRILLVPLGIQIIPYMAHVMWVWNYLK